MNAFPQLFSETAPFNFISFTSILKKNLKIKYLMKPLVLMNFFFQSIELGYSQIVLVRDETKKMY